MLVANCLQKYKNNTRKGNFLLSFLTITSKKATNSLFPLSALMYAYEKFAARPTLDIDFLGNNISNEGSSIIAAFREICSVPYEEDGVIFDTELSNTYTGVLGNYVSFNKNDISNIYELVNRFVSFYGNAAYTYDGKYMVTGSIRWDRTNLFATGSKYQKKPIWSVGAGWNLDKESFFKVSFINMMKLRFSCGIGGNIAKNSAPYMTAYYNNNTHVGGIQGTISNRPNPDLRWEKTTTANIGVDFSMFRNRLNGSIEYYNKSGVDLLANTNGVPTEGFGFSTYTMNNGKMRNRGFELTLSSDVIMGKDWLFYK